MNDISTIVPQKGVGELLLGASKDQTLQYFGNADETVDIESNGNQVLRWKKGIECEFYKDMKGRLNSISLSHPETILAGRKIIGESQVEALSGLADVFGQPELSDQSGKGRGDNFWMANYEDVGIILWIENNAVSGVTVCVNSWEKNDGTPIPNPE